MDLLFEHASLGSDTRNQIKEAVGCLLGADELMFDFNHHLLIGEYTICLEGVEKPLSLIGTRLFTRVSSIKLW